MKRLLGVVAVSLALIACGPPPKYDRGLDDPGRVLRLNEVNARRGGKYTFYFTDMETGQLFQWTTFQGRTVDRLTYLNVGDCYTLPIDRTLHEEVPCP